MALIKANNSSHLIKDAIVLDMGDLGRQAERLLSGARAEAVRILAEAKAQADQLIAEADGRGHAQGLERGEQEGRQAGIELGRKEAVAQFAQQLRQITQAWTEALERWNGDRAAMLHEAQADVIRFADAVARRVVHRMVQADPTIIQDQLRHALELVSRPSRLRITMHPDDRALAEEVLPGLMAAIGGGAEAILQVDASLTRGGCVLATDHGRIDASIDRQLDRIAEALVPSGASMSGGEPQADDPSESPQT